MIFCLLTWFDVWTHADVVRVGNRPELILSTLAASIGIVTTLVGWAGILLNNRSFLAVFTFFLWLCFAMLVVPGYITYKRRTFNIEGKINSQWSRSLGDAGRLRIQNSLECCGYFSPFVEPDMPFQERSPRVQACVLGFREIRPRQVVQDRLWYRPLAYWCHRLWLVVLQPCHISVWKKHDAKGLPIEHEQYGRHYG